MKRIYIILLYIILFTFADATVIRLNIFTEDPSQLHEIFHYPDIQVLRVHRDGHIDAIIESNQVAVLNNLNITTVGELIKTPDWVLETALGNYYKIVKFFIHGGDYQIHDSIKSISRETTLPEDTMSKELIYALFLYLIERGCNALREKKLLAKTLTVKVRFSDFKTISRRSRIPYNNAQQMIFEYGARILENLLKENSFTHSYRLKLLGDGFFTCSEENLYIKIFTKHRH